MRQAVSGELGRRATRASSGVLRRLFPIVVALNVATACATGQATPGPSAASSTPGASGGVESSAPSGFFTDPPAPHDLQSTLASAAATSGVIGWEGGRLEASGPSGATYTLEIPPHSLPVSTEITMTPLSALAGFGLAAAPEHVLGVELEPDGLQLVVPATLTMTPGVALPRAGIASGDYLADGKDAALLLAETSEAAITFEISHFSGYWSIWPLQMPDWRVFELDRQAATERRIQSMMAQFLGFRRQQELLGIAVAPLDVILRNLMKAFDFDKEVLEGRLALASNGCYEAQSAIQAFLTYDEQLQKMGIADDKELYAEFKRPVPPALLRTAWNICLDEEFARCRAIGELPRLMTFLLSHLRQRALFGESLTDKEISDGQDRLKRCGHWRVRLNTSQLDFDAGFRREMEWTSEIDVRWKGNGDGPFGIGNLDLGDGEGDIVVNKLILEVSATVVCCHRNFQTYQKAAARINGMAFSTVPEGVEPVPTMLNLWVDAGTISYDYTEVGKTKHADGLPWPGAPVLFGGSDLNATIDKGWQFRTRPYRAVFALQKAAPAPADRTARIEVIVEHTPD
jgi:hypothetical protein